MYGDAPPFRPARPEPLLTRAIPVAGQLPGYRAPSARRDLVAGVTVAALALPSAMAYAEVAGLSPVNGLYALLLPTVAYMLLGSSRQLIVGPEGSVSTLVGVAVLPLAVAGSADAAELAAMLALLVAACFVLAWLLRLGWIADYFSRPVLVGYIHGVAVVLDHRPAREAARALDRRTRPARRSCGRCCASSASVSGATVERRRGRARRPARLRFLLPQAARRRCWSSSPRSGSRGRSTCRPTASRSSARSPRDCRASTCRAPRWQRRRRARCPRRSASFSSRFADEILTARSFAGKHNQHVRASQELLAMGAANAAAGFTQGFSIGASGSRTAVNDSMGARSQVAGLVAAATVLVILLFLTEPVQYLPKAVLGAVIVSAAVGLVDPRAWRALAAVDASRSRSPA